MVTTSLPSLFRLDFWPYHFNGFGGSHPAWAGAGRILAGAGKVGMSELIVRNEYVLQLKYVIHVTTLTFVDIMRPTLSAIARWYMLYLRKMKFQILSYIYLSRPYHLHIFNVTKTWWSKDNYEKVWLDQFMKTIFMFFLFYLSLS